MAVQDTKIGSLYKNYETVRREYLSKLSLTSQFRVSLLLGNASAGGADLLTHLIKCNLISNDQNEKYDIMCSEAVLPGSTFDMAEEYGSRQGVIERFPTRRIYSDFNLTFYVDIEYDLIRLFEEWMNFIDPIYGGENTQYNGSPVGYGGEFLESRNYYRFKYPEKYKRNIAITKFEKDFLVNPNKGSQTRNQTSLTYYFVDAFPTNLTALPLSYEGSTITKTTVNFNYTRYTVNKHKGTELPPRSSKNPANPDQPNSNFIFGNEPADYPDGFDQSVINQIGDFPGGSGEGIE